MSQTGKTIGLVVPLLTIGFSLFLIWVVAIANMGEINRYFGFFIELPYGDKIGHFLLMGTLSFMANLSFKANRFAIGSHRFLIGTVLVLVFVSIEEFSQIFVSSRTFSLGDWSADFAGILLFGWIAEYVVRKQSVEDAQ